MEKAKKETVRFVEDNFEDLLRGIEARIFFASLKVPNSEFIEAHLKARYPHITEDMVDEVIGRTYGDYFAIRKLQRFGRMRGEIIKNLGDVVENDPVLNFRYFNLVEGRAESYNPKGILGHLLTEDCELLSEVLTQKGLTPSDWNLEQRKKLVDGQLLRLCYKRKELRVV